MTGAISTVTVGATTTAVLGIDSDRLAAVLSNISDERIDVAIGTAAVAGQGVGIPATGVLVITKERGAMLAINAICASGGKALSVQTVSR